MGGARAGELRLFRFGTRTTMNVWKIFAGHTGAWFDVKTASLCTTELWEAQKSFILSSWKIKAAPYPMIVSLDTLKQRFSHNVSGFETRPKTAPQCSVKVINFWQSKFVCTQSPCPVFGIYTAGLATHLTMVMAICPVGLTQTKNPQVVCCSNAESLDSWPGNNSSQLLLILRNISSLYCLGWIPFYFQISKHYFLSSFIFLPIFKLCVQTLRFLKHRTHATRHLRCSILLVNGICVITRRCMHVCFPCKLERQQCPS